VIYTPFINQISPFLYQKTPKKRHFSIENSHFRPNLPGYPQFRALWAAYPPSVPSFWRPKRPVFSKNWPPFPEQGPSSGLCKSADLIVKWGGFMVKLGDFMVKYGIFISKMGIFGFY
jgi:hypothetical protein